MGAPFVKLAANRHQNRKVRKAGLFGWSVYELALCQNALVDGDGWVPLADFTDFEWVAEQIQCTPQQAQDGFGRAVESGLMHIDGPRLVISGWDDEWSRRPLTHAERQAKYRDRRKSSDEVTEPESRKVTSDAGVTRDESDVGEERRGEENREREPASDSGKKGKRKGAIPADWKPNESAIAKCRALGLDLNAEVESFRDHHASKGTLFADYDAGFRTWMRRSVEFGRGGKPAAQTSLPVPRKL